MTTVAFDGRTMAADTLATDAWGMKETVRDKILRGPDFLAGSAGQNGAIKRWWAQVSGMSLAEGEGIAGTVVKEGKTTVVKDCQSDARWAGRFDAETGFVTRSTRTPSEATVKAERVPMFAISAMTPMGASPAMMETKTAPATVTM